MMEFFWFYRRFTGTIFFLWLFSRLAKKFGFVFALDLSLFSRLFLFLFLILVAWEIRTKWSVISRLIKNPFLKIKNEFFIMTRTTQKEIVAFFPRVLTGRIGSFLALVLAITVSFFRLFWGFTKALIAFIFRPMNIMIFMILGIFANIFILDFTSGLIILFLTGSLVYVIRQYKFNGEFSVAGSLIFLTICPFLLIFKKEQMAEKAGIWAYMFLVIGVIQMAWESKKDFKSK